MNFLSGWVSWSFRYTSWHIRSSGWYPLVDNHGMSAFHAAANWSCAIST